MAYSPPDDYDAELAELEWFYARRRRRQRIWAVLAVVVAVSMLMLYILADFFRARGRSTREDPPAVQVMVEINDSFRATELTALPVGAWLGDERDRAAPGYEASGGRSSTAPTAANARAAKPSTTVAMNTTIMTLTRNERTVT